jgi:hypothetical protein
VTLTPSRADIGRVFNVCVVVEESVRASPRTAAICIAARVRRCEWAIGEGESLFSTASSLGVSWQQIYLANKGTAVTRPDSTFTAGQVVRLGHVTKALPGDTLAIVAARYGTDVGTLLRLNRDVTSPSERLAPGGGVCVVFQRCK